MYPHFRTYPSTTPNLHSGGSCLPVTTEVEMPRELPGGGPASGVPSTSTTRPNNVALRMGKSIYGVWGPFQHLCLEVDICFVFYFILLNFNYCTAFWCFACPSPHFVCSSSYTDCTVPLRGRQHPPVDFNNIDFWLHQQATKDYLIFRCTILFTW